MLAVLGIIIGIAIGLAMMHDILIFFFVMPNKDRYKINSNKEEQTKSKKYLSNRY